MTTVLTPWPRSQFLDNNGRPAVNYQLFTYEAGTSTKLATYTDSTGLLANTNPIRLNFRGEAGIWVPPNVAYKYVFAPPTDTDPPSNPIWTVDQLVSSQLVTLYGGVDTGVANAYVLTFTANFTAYADGIVIYWIPATTNTTASTINVNGLGIVSIVNQDGSALTSSQLVAGQVATIMYLGGQFLLISSGIAPSVVSGTFTPAWTGFSVDPVGDMAYTKIGALVILQADALMTGTSNATGMSITNLPAILRPPTAAEPRGTCMVTDNSAQALGAFSFGVAAGTIKFWKGTAPPNDAGFTNSGLKGFPPFTPIIYPVL